MNKETIKVTKIVASSYEGTHEVSSGEREYIEFKDQQELDDFTDNFRRISNALLINSTIKIEYTKPQ